MGIAKATGWGLLYLCVIEVMGYSQYGRRITWLPQATLPLQLMPVSTRISNPQSSNLVKPT